MKKMRDIFHSLLILAFIISCGKDPANYKVKNNEETEIQNVTTCEYNDKSYKSGESFQAIDGCNTCKCNDGNAIECTIKSCK